MRSTPTPEFRNCIDENTGDIDLRLLPKIAKQAIGQLTSEMYRKIEKAKADGTMSPQEFESAVRNIRETSDALAIVIATEHPLRAE